MFSDVESLHWFSHFNQFRRFIKLYGTHNLLIIPSVFVLWSMTMEYIATMEKWAYLFITFTVITTHPPILAHVNRLELLASKATHSISNFSLLIDCCLCVCVYVCFCEGIETDEIFTVINVFFFFAWPLMMIKSWLREINSIYSYQ